MNTHIVTKALPRGEVVLNPGTEVDASDWRHVRSLQEQRYIKPLGAVAAVMQNVRDNGELADIVRPIQPNERGKRMGRKEKDGDTRN